MSNSFILRKSGNRTIGCLLALDARGCRACAELDSVFESYFSDEMLH
ncbi:hypothetical protein [Winogradskyella sp. 3972H.M.0a.05]